MLDPFCGCATSCIAAELNNRQWIGIDVSKEAYRLVNSRIKTDVEERLGFPEKIVAYFRDDIPERTDTIRNPLKKTEIKHTLFGKQEGICNGCKEVFPF